MRRAIARIGFTPRAELGTAGAQPPAPPGGGRLPRHPLGDKKLKRGKGGLAAERQPRPRPSGRGYRFGLCLLWEPIPPHGTPTKRALMTKELKQLLVDLIKLAADEDHGVYSSDEIDDLRARAETILIGGDDAGAHEDLAGGIVKPLQK